jgi:hypothetical protein
MLRRLIQLLAVLVVPGVLWALAAVVRLRSKTHRYAAPDGAISWEIKS